MNKLYGLNVTLFINHQYSDFQISWIPYTNNS